MLGWSSVTAFGGFNSAQAFRGKDGCNCFASFPVRLGVAFRQKHKTHQLWSIVTSTHFIPSLISYHVVHALLKDTTGCGPHERRDVRALRCLAVLLKPQNGCGTGKALAMRCGKLKFARGVALTLHSLLCLALCRALFISKYFKLEKRVARPCCLLLLKEVGMPGRLSFPGSPAQGESGLQPGNIWEHRANSPYRSLFLRIQAYPEWSCC